MCFRFASFVFLPGMFLILFKGEKKKGGGGVNSKIFCRWYNRIINELVSMFIGVIYGEQLLTQNVFVFCLVLFCFLLWEFERLTPFTLFTVDSEL